MIIGSCIYPFVVLEEQNFSHHYVPFYMPYSTPFSMPYEPRFWLNMKNISKHFPKSTCLFFFIYATGLQWCLENIIWYKLYSFWIKWSPKLYFFVIYKTSILPETLKDKSSRLYLKCSLSSLIASTWDFWSTVPLQQAI